MRWRKDGREEENETGGDEKGDERKERDGEKGGDGREEICRREEGKGRDGGGDIVREMKEK